MGQMASAINRLEAQRSSKVPSQVVQNANCSAVSLRNGRELVELEKVKAKPKQNVVIPILVEEEEELMLEDSPPPPPNDKEEAVAPRSKLPIYKPKAPFPEALKGKRKEEQDEGIYETFRKCEVNIPLLDLLNSVPRYAKFLKELCTIKRTSKLKSIKKLKPSEYVSALFPKKLPPKCNDPGMFTTPCTLGDSTFDDAMLDLGASINVIPYSVYESSNLGPLKETNVVVQLANRSNVYPRGVVENVVVKVGKLAFPADFYVLDMNHDPSAISILLGRPFLNTTKTKIDVSKGSLTMQHDKDIVRFDMNRPSVKPLNTSSLCAINIDAPSKTSDICIDDDLCLDVCTNPQLPSKELVKSNLKVPSKKH